MGNWNWRIETRNVKKLRMVSLDAAVNLKSPKYRNSGAVDVFGSVLFPNVKSESRY